MSRGDICILYILVLFPSFFWTKDPKNSWCAGLINYVAGCRQRNVKCKKKKEEGKEGGKEEGKEGREGRREERKKERKKNVNRQFLARNL